MKKRLISLIAVLSIFTALCSTSAIEISPRWTFLARMTTLIQMQGSSLYWGATAECYNLPQVTHAGITISLQEANSYGWVTIDTDTVKTPGRDAYSSNYYDNWVSGKSYRIKTEVWVYQNNVKLEYAGPVYQYYNT